MPSIINSTTTSPGGLISTGASDNALNIQTGNTTAITINSSQVVSLANPLPVASGGTGSTSTTYCNLTTNVTGTLPVANGGTGQSTLTANNVLLGNGTSGVQAVAPGSNGNVLTSNGTTWTSAAAAGGPNPLHGDQVFTSSGTFNVPAGVTAVKVTVIAAAGNGGTGILSDAAGGGGGAGGYVVDYVAVTPGGTATVTVGTNGGTRTSSFAGGTTLTASGGSNGANASSGANGTQGLAGAASVFGQTYYSAGSVRTGDGVYIGNGRVTVSNAQISSFGGVYEHGYGVAGTSRSNITGSTNKHIPLGFGAGGGGGETDTGTQTGGTGTNGAVIVEW